MEDDWGDSDWDPDYYDGGAYGPDDDSIVTLAPFIVGPGDDDSNVGPDTGEGDWERWSFPINFGPEEEDEYGGEGGPVYVAPDPTAQILASLNGYRPGWEKISSSEYLNRSTGEKYNADTGEITKPSSSTNPGGTRPGGSNTRPGGSSGGGSTGGGSTGGGTSSGSNTGQSAIDKALATIGSLVNAFTKVAGAVHGTTPASPAATAAAAAAQQEKNAQTGKVILAIGTVALVLFLKRKKP